MTVALGNLFAALTILAGARALYCCLASRDPLLEPQAGRRRLWRRGAIRWTLPAGWLMLAAWVCWQVQGP